MLKVCSHSHIAMHFSFCCCHRLPGFLFNGGVQGRFAHIGRFAPGCFTPNILGAGVGSLHSLQLPY